MKPWGFNAAMCPPDMPAGRHADRPDAAIMDAPLWQHWPKLVLWLALEGVLLGISVLLTTAHPAVMGVPAIGDCSEQDWKCAFNGPVLALLGCNTGCVVLYFLIYAYFIRKAFTNLKDQPYSSMRMANLTARLQARCRCRCRCLCRCRCRCRCCCCCCCCCDPCNFLSAALSCFWAIHDHPACNSSIPPPAGAPQAAADLVLHHLHHNLHVRKALHVLLVHPVLAWLSPNGKWSDCRLN